jgi:hypothetical protein
VLAEHFFLEKIRAYMGSYYQLSNYINYFGRRDNTYNITTGVGYTFFHKLCELGLEYDLTNNGSNLSGLGYTDNVIMLRLTTKYDLPKNEERP